MNPRKIHCRYCGESFGVQADLCFTCDIEETKLDIKEFYSKARNRYDFKSYWLDMARQGEEHLALLRAFRTQTNRSTSLSAEDAPQ